MITSLLIHHQAGNKIYTRNQQLQPLIAFYPLALMGILILSMATILLFVINYQLFVKINQIWFLIILDYGLIIGGPVIRVQLRE